MFGVLPCNNVTNNAAFVGIYHAPREEVHVGSCDSKTLGEEGRGDLPKGPGDVHDGVHFGEGADEAPAEEGREAVAD